MVIFRIPVTTKIQKKRRREAVQMPNGTGRSRLKDLCLRRHRLAHGEENAGHTAWTRKRSDTKQKKFDISDMYLICMDMLFYTKITTTLFQNTRQVK